MRTGYCKKARHVTRSSAKRARSKMIRQCRGLTKGSLSVYHCEACECYHIGRRREHDRVYTSIRRHGEEYV